MNCELWIANCELIKKSLRFVWNKTESQHGLGQEFDNSRRPELWARKSGNERLGKVRIGIREGMPIRNPQSTIRKRLVSRFPSLSFVALLLFSFSPLSLAAFDLDEAERAIAAGMPHAIIPSLKQAIVSLEDPVKLQHAQWLLAEAYLVGGQADQALEQLELLTTVFGEQLWFAGILRGEALLALGRYEEALFAIEQVLMNQPEPHNSPSTMFRWAGLQSEFLKDRARLVYSRILVALERYLEALEVLKDASKTSSLGTEIMLDRASLLLELNRLDEAEEVFKQISNGDLEQQNRVDFLQAKWLKAKGNREEASIRFQSLASRPSAYSEMSLVQAGECLMELGLLDEAENLIEQYLRDSRGRQWRLPVFALLDRLYEKIYQVRGSVSSSELRRLAFDQTEPERAMTAWFYLGRNEARLGKRDSAIVVLQRFMFDYPNHPLWKQAHLETAGWLMERGDYGEADKVLARIPDQAVGAFLSGVANFRRGDYAAAQKHFVAAAKESDIREAAIFNAKLARLLGGDAGVAIAELFSKELSRKFQLVEAFVAAHRRDPQAVEKLTKLIPTANGRAQLALAEWAFAQLDYGRARQLVETLAQKDASEQAAYLEVFLADDGEDDASDRVLAAANDYLKKFPSGNHVPDVRVKIAEMLIANGDYLGGRTQLQKVIGLVPGTALASRARFLSAQAASKLMTAQFLDEAMLEFEEVARSDEGLAMKARFEQALVQNALNQPEQALVLLDQVVTKSRDLDLCNSALIEKGDTFFSMGKTDPKYFEDAVKTWRILADDSQVNARWRNEARCKMGLALEKLNRPEEALEAFYKVILSPEGATGDYMWYCRSGFEAGRLLEKTLAVKEAIRIYDQLAKLGGPRAEEARSRANRLRLENFIWEE